MMNKKEQITIRRAAKSDCPHIMELIQELALFEKAPEQVTVTLTHFEKSGFGNNPVWWGLVAINETQEIVAVAIYYIRYSTWKGQTMYLEDIIVTEKYRRFGIGQQLLDALKQEAKEKKLPLIQWQVLEWNKPAIQFYQKNKAELDAEWINCKLPIKFSS